MKYTYVTLKSTIWTINDPSKSEITDLDMSCHDSTPYKFYDTREQAFTAALNDKTTDEGNLFDEADYNDFADL